MKQFVPQKDEKEIISLRISSSLLKRVEEKSNEYQISRNEMIIQSVEFALENLGEAPSEK